MSYYWSFALLQITVSLFKPLLEKKKKLLSLAYAAVDFFHNEKNSRKEKIEAFYKSDIASHRCSV